MAVVEVLDRKRTQHIDSRLVEKHDNSRLDTRRYNVRMPNSEIREHTANLVAENLFAQCDEDGNYRILFDQIIDHKHDETAIPIEKARIYQYKIFEDGSYAFDEKMIASVGYPENC